MNKRALPFLLSTAVAPLLLAPPAGRCPQCPGVSQTVAIEVEGSTAWHEFDVQAGRRHELIVFTREGQVAASFVPFDVRAGVHDIHCERDDVQLLCEFTPRADGQVGVAVSAEERSEVIVEFAVD